MFNSGKIWTVLDYIILLKHLKSVTVHKIFRKLKVINVIIGMLTN